MLLETGGAQPGNGRRSSVSAFVGLPSSFCAHVRTILFILFFPVNNKDVAKADFALEQCFISLCNSVYFPGAKPNGKYLLNCKEILIIVPYSSIWLDSCCFKSLGMVFSIAWICLCVKSELYN